MKKNKNTRLAIILTSLAFAMLGLSFAAVPLYDLFCRVTGFAGTPRTEVDAATVPVEESNNLIKVRFDSTVDPSLAWDFYPEEREVTVNLDNVNTHYYIARNRTDQEITGFATYNVTPLTASYFVAKIDCFCFSEQVLKPYEEVRMKIVYYIDKDIRASDSEARNVPAVTLSYTFFSNPSDEGN